MSVTDGSISAKMSEMRVSIDGAATTSTIPVSGTVTSNQGTAAATAGAWPMKVSNGTATADLAPVNPSGLGNALLVSTGTMTPTTTLSAVSATGAGTAVNYESAHTNITLAITASAGVSAGAVALEVSHDGTNWFRSTPVTQSAPGVTSVTITGAWSRARGNVTTTITGGTVSATIMAA